MRKLKRWQIPLYAFASFGPCMLSTIISVYLVDALQTQGFGVDVEYWTFANKTIIAVGLFSILKAISSLMDGLTEVPCAHIVQNLKTPWGKRRPAIIVGTVVLTLAYVLFCFPISQEENSVANSRKIIAKYWNHGRINERGSDPVTVYLKMQPRFLIR